METHGPLGTLWAGLGLGAFYLALLWVNLLLGHFLTPLFLIPLTWLQDYAASGKAVLLATHDRDLPAHRRIGLSVDSTQAFRERSVGV